MQHILLCTTPFCGRRYLLWHFSAPKIQTPRSYGCPDPRASVYLSNRSSCHTGPVWVWLLLSLFSIG